MKRTKILINISIIIILLFGSTIKSSAQVPEFKVLYLQFADTLKVDAFKKTFSYNRWKRRVRRATSASDLAKTLIRLVRKIRSTHKKRVWRKKRRNWREFLYNAVSISEVAKSLYKFEINLRWSATKRNWRRDRRLWVRRIQSLY